MNDLGYPNDIIYVIHFYFLIYFYYVFSITIYPLYTLSPAAVTTLLSVSMSPFSFLPNPSTP